MAAVRHVVLVGFPDVQSLDITGPLEVFSLANRLGADPPYTTELVGRVDVLRTSSGLRLGVDRLLADVRGPIDTLVVPGGVGTPGALADEELVRWVATTAERARRVASVCSGAFLLAEAGLLDGRSATTHWSVGDLLARLHPDVSVEPDRIYVRDGRVWTSAGVTAGIDLALALVEEDHGGHLALDVARWLVVFTQRAGGQSQFSAQLAVRRPERAVLREVLAYIAAHPEADLTVPALAERAHMSVRTFARAFQREVGTTPGAHVQATRLEAARRLLETTDRGIDDIARACGFGNAETLHRAFQRELGTTPGRYRQHFAVPV